MGDGSVRRRRCALGIAPYGGAARARCGAHPRPRLSSAPGPAPPELHPQRRAPPGSGGRAALRCAAGIRAGGRGAERGGAGRGRGRAWPRCGAPAAGAGCCSPPAARPAAPQLPARPSRSGVPAVPGAAPRSHGAPAAGVQRLLPGQPLVQGAGASPRGRAGEDQ